MDTPSDSKAEKRPSVLKYIGWYCLVWLALVGLFVAYVTFAPDHGGFDQATANLVASLAGIAFGLGLFVVLMLKARHLLFPKPYKPKSYRDELPR